MFSSAFLLFGLASISQYVAPVHSQTILNINDKMVMPGEAPYQIILYNATSHEYFCGGALVNSLYAITSAQCVYGRKKEDIIVVAGTNMIYVSRNYRNKRKVKEIIIHEQYNNFNLWRNDIALLRFSRYLLQTGNVHCVRIPTEQDRRNVIEDIKATVSGYGIISRDHRPMFFWLLKLDTYIASQEYCQNVFKTIQYAISETQICAHDPYKLSIFDIRISDLGGPLVVNGTLFGIASSSIIHFPQHLYNDEIYPPMVFTNVVSYRNWIWMRILDRADSDKYK